MVFAFFPTALLFILSMMFFGASIAAFFMNSLLFSLIGLGLMIASWVSEMIAIKSSHKLYTASMTILPQDYEKWLARQIHISKCSLGMKRIYVVSNIVYGALTYEDTQTAKEYLEMLRPYAEKKKYPLTEFLYYSGLVTLTEKLHDLKSAEEYLAKMYEALNSPKFPKNGFRPLYMNTAEYARAEIEFYKRTPEQLKTENRSTAELLISLSRIKVSNNVSISSSLAYNQLDAYYNTGLAYTVLGDEKTADEYFNKIAESNCSYPIISRVRQYLEKRDISILYSMIP